MTTQGFWRFTLTEIITKTWRLKARAKIEKLGENFFKFSFSNKEDKDMIFRNWPWSLNGAHLNLKQWPEDKALNEISIDTSTFYLQVHGLPPQYIHPRTARLIGGKVGSIHPSSINRKCVVANRFLRFRAEILVINPLSAGFFMERNDGNDLWIQFKLERLSDFCYTCGLIDHVTGKCNSKAPMIVTNPNGLSAKLFGPWMRAENNDTLCFINAPVRA